MAINTGISFGPMKQDRLVNKGTCTNYGIELTVERFFNDGYYYLLTTSVFNSRYEGSDGIERKTVYNTRYVVNALAGKEWALKGGKFFSENVKVTTIGRSYLTPLDYELSQARGTAVYQESSAFSVKQNVYFRVDLRLSVRQKVKKSTLEASWIFRTSQTTKIFSQNCNPRTKAVTDRLSTSILPGFHV
jgi:hypothetical protein